MQDFLKRGFYSESLDWFSFENLMNNAYVMKWTGPILIEWEPAAFEKFFRRSDRDKLGSGKVCIFMQQGVIANLVFTSNPVVDFFDKNLALDNLIILLRALEGMSDAPKLEARAMYERIEDVARFPRALDIPAHQVMSYALLADDAALKDEAAFREWPDQLDG